MPRKNRPAIPARRLPPQKPETGKVRYPSKQAAEAQIRESRKYNDELELSVYHSPTDGGWYLTSRARANDS
jgi:hypothetical protein